MEPPREVLEAMRAIVDYNWQPELRDYEEQIEMGQIEPGEPAHVFTKLKLVDHFLTERGVE